ncbi:MAG: 3-phosphoshikimate 1-carboxyvinyltransferase [Pirellulaceae bacterium]
MPDSVEVQLSGPVDGVIRPPGSKSLTNRALIIAALAEGKSTLRGALTSEDTEVMIESLRRLGIDIIHDNADHCLTVVGCGGEFPVDDAELFIANSGTSMRFLTAMLSIGQGRFRLDGIPRMRERPIGDLIIALEKLGADIKSDTNNGCPPVVVVATGLKGGTATIAGNISSQYLSGLLMAAPYARSPVTLEVAGELVSRPYVRMTTEIMGSFGLEVEEVEPDHFKIPAPSVYRACDYTIEPDASAASYFWAAAAITGGRMTVEGLSRSSLQGDVGFCECLRKMGCEVEYRNDSITVVGGQLRGINVDMADISDTVQTLAAVALFAEGATTVTGVAHNRHKETDRISDLARELRKLGAEVTELSDGLTITPRPLGPAAVDTYNDHRMAMSLALVGLKVRGVVVNNPGCTGKTYPHFFEDLRSITVSPHSRD